MTLGDLATVTADLPDGVSPGVHPAGSDPAAAARHLLVILLLAGLMLIVLGVTLAVAR